MQYTSAITLLTSLIPLTHARYIAPPELDANQLVASFECSHGPKEWRICHQPSAWGTMYYCPTYHDYNETELGIVEWGELGVYTPLMPCHTCPTVEQGDCATYVPKLLSEAGITPEMNNSFGGSNIFGDGIAYCQELCEFGKEGDRCNQDWENQCTPGEGFCDYESDSAEFGVCKACPTDALECLEDGFATSVRGETNCRDCRLGCYMVGASKLHVDGEFIDSQPIDKGVQAKDQTATGELYDCSDMIVDARLTCEGAEGKMCLVYNDNNYALAWQISNQAEKSGCVGVIIFVNYFYTGPYSHTNSELRIPFVYITEEVGLDLIKNKIGATATIEVDVFGSACYSGWETERCAVDWPCPQDQYCEFNQLPATDTDTSYTEGYCLDCPLDENGVLDPMVCYFDTQYDPDYDNDLNIVSTRTIQRVQECASRCGAELTSEKCKFCTSEVSAFEFGVEDADDRCLLCPEFDVQYRDRVVPLFGPDVKCWQLESFFYLLPVPKESRNCQLAQSMNFICGCSGTGYAGAKTQSHQAALVWMPRVAAILSILGSIFIIVDSQRTPVKRSKTINKILCTISVFDIIGSIAMAFTSLPTPETDYIYGAKGNEKTCTAQAFLIQMGTVACFLGVSLAVYYHLTIKKGWSEAKIKRRKMIYYLLVPPIVIGFTYAGIGIPYYDNVMVWCNNSARWWPEVPVILAILYSTVLMVDVWYSVYKKESMTAQYTGGSYKLSRMVFHQALWFVGSFYATWVPYLALQYMWSSGTGYQIYGLTLVAATLVPLQGFFNALVYARPRYFKKITIFTSLFGSLRSSTSRARRHTPQSVTEKPSTAASSAIASSNPSGNTLSPAPIPSAATASTAAKSTNATSSVGNRSSLEMESEVVQFGAPDPESIEEDAKEKAKYEMFLAG